MIKVCFDYKAFFEQPLGGVSKYIVELNKSLNNLDCDAKILSPFHINKYLINDKYSNCILKFNNHYPRFTRQIFEELNKILVKSHIKKINPSIFHFTDFNNFYLNETKIKKITTVYDLIHEKFEKLYKLPKDYKVKKKIFLKKMDHIICISNNTKKDLIDFYNIDENKINVVHLGIIQEKEEKLKEIQLEPKKPFILFVGSRKRYKNFLGFLKAFSLSKNLINDFDIVCFGNQLFSEEENLAIDNLKLRENMYLVMGDDNELNNYYKNAELFIFPSLYEGFGLPMLEAMKNGCAISCSNTSSLQEIGEGVADFFSPNDEESILNSLKKVLYSKDYQKKLIKNGYNKVSKFSWNNCAKSTLEVYKKVDE